MPSVEDKFKQVLLEDGPESLVLVETKMVRGSTHDKDRVSLTTLVDGDNLDEELSELRDAAKLEMADRRKFNPDNFGEDDG